MERSSQELAVIALGADPDFLRWAEEVCDEEVERCRQLDVALRLLREQLIELVLCYMPDLQLETSKLLPLLRLEAPNLPLVAVFPEPVDSEQIRSLRAMGITEVVCLKTEGDQLKELLAGIREFSSHQRTLDGSVRRLSSALKALEQWRDETTRVVDELLHDLRTPAGVLVGFAANLIDGIHGELSVEQLEVMGRIKGAANYLSELLGGARERLPPHGGSVVEQMDVREPRRRGRRQIFLGEVCEQVVEMFSPKAAAAQVELTFFRQECPAIWAERSRIVQLLVNLVSNALRHTPAGGSIDVVLGSDTDRGGTVRACRLTVRDTGKGIAQEQHEAIFEAGFTTGAPSDHQGMGLAICQQVIGEHQGTIELESEPGMGATFHCRLPLDPRTRARSISMGWVEDMTLVGQLLVELRRRNQGMNISLQKQTDMESVAKRLLATGGEVLLTGKLDPSLKKIVSSK